MAVVTNAVVVESNVGICRVHDALAADMVASLLSPAARLVNFENGCCFGRAHIETYPPTKSVQLLAHRTHRLLKRALQFLLRWITNQDSAMLAVKHKQTAGGRCGRTPLVQDFVNVFKPARAPARNNGNR